MGMFDSFYFAKGLLPDNKVGPDHEFQTKSLSCDLDRYYVDEHGHVTKKEMFGGDDDYRELTGNDKPINECAYVYSHEFLYEGTDILTRKYLGCRYQEYKVLIVNSKLVHVEKISEEGYET